MRITLPLMETTTRTDDTQPFRLTRHHALLLTGIVASREADALYYGDDGRTLPTAEEREQAEHLYQLAVDVRCDVEREAGDDALGKLYDDIHVWMGGAL